MIKNFGIILILLLLFISCSKNKDIKGFWHSEYKELLKFEDDLCINYFSYRDTVSYSLSEGKLIWSGDYEKNLNFKVKIIEDELFIYDYEKDSLLIKFQRKKSQNYFFDYINDKALNIQLPKGNGKIRRFGTLDYDLYNPLYLTYQEDKLISNFNGITKIIDDSFYRFLRKNLDSPFDELSNRPISLILDKNVKMKDIILLKKHLRLAGFENIHYLNEIDTYDEVNYIGMWMLPLSKGELDRYDLDFTEEDKYDWEKSSEDDDVIPVVTSEFVKEEIIISRFDYRDSIFIDVKPRAKLLEIDKSEIKFDNKKISLTELENAVKSNITNNSDFVIIYYITDDSTYQNFINVLDVIYNSIEELRKEYLLEKYNMEYPLARNNPQLNSTIEKDRIREAKRKFPFGFFRMNYDEYNEVKKSL